MIRLYYNEDMFERGTRNCKQRIFRKVWSRYIQNFDQIWMIEKRLGLSFLFTDLCQHFGIILVSFAHLWIAGNLK